MRCANVIFARRCVTHPKLLIWAVILESATCKLMVVLMGMALNAAAHADSSELNATFATQGACPRW